MSDTPTKCATCSAKPNLRLWRKGKERWLYNTVRWGFSYRKVWTCGECWKRIELEDRNHEA